MAQKEHPAGSHALARIGDVVTDLPPSEVGEHHGGFVWLHIEGFGRNGLPELPSYVPRLPANALLAGETRPRCDQIEGAALVNLRGTGQQATPDSDRLVSIRVWVEGSRVTSVSRNRLAALEKVEMEMRAGRLEDGGDFVATLARAISTELDPQVADLSDQLDECEELIENANIYALRRRIAALRSQAIALRRFVAPDRDALASMAQLKFTWISEEDRLHLREGTDRFARMAEELEAVRERAALLHEQLTDLRAEIVDRRSLAIAIVAFIFLPLTFITGLLGMNVEGIPYADRHWAFWGVIGLCSLLSLVVLGWFTVRQWLQD